MPSEITVLLNNWRSGDPTAMDSLAPLIEAELRRLAHYYMGKERPGHLLETTALVNEAYLRLAGQGDFEYQDRAHFFAVCAQVMRHVLIDHARARSRDKRGGGAARVSLDGAGLVAAERSADLVALDEALRDLEAVDARKARIIELRYFAGLTLEETAGLLGVAEITVRREERRARAWLRRAMAGGEEGAGGDAR
jgi:RNA polymerase sigma-70 factor, ECF subfamily